MPTSTTEHWLIPGSGELFGERTEGVSTMSPEELRRAITGPAERVGVAMEPALVGALERDVLGEPGSLPLLQYTLTEMFDSLSGPTLTWQAYREKGGVTDALAARADAIFSELTASEQEEARRMFLRLVAVTETGEQTKKRVLRAELSSAVLDEEALDAVLDQYGHYRLVTFDRDPATRRPTVEVAHEALIRVWPRLRAWLDDSRESLQLHSRLQTASREWIASGRDPENLAVGARLSQFEALLLESKTSARGQNALPLTTEEQAYVEHSMRRRERERGARDRLRRRITLGLAAGLVLTLVLALVAVTQSIQANDQRRNGGGAAKDRLLAGACGKRRSAGLDQLPAGAPACH